MPKKENTHKKSQRDILLNSLLDAKVDNKKLTSEDVVDVLFTMAGIFDHLHKNTHVQDELHKLTSPERIAATQDIIAVQKAVRKAGMPCPRG